MILVFGGTTEGRKAIKELEEAGKPFFYSTKTGEQDAPVASWAVTATANCQKASSPSWSPSSTGSFWARRNLNNVGIVHIKERKNS